MAEYIEREAFLEDVEERYCLPCNWCIYLLPQLRCENGRW